MVEPLAPQVLGYDNAVEVKVRLRYMYLTQQMADFSVVFSGIPADKHANAYP